MTKILRKIISTPSRWMQGVIQQEIEHSNNSKITTDANGNAILNMDNQQVQESMQARMKELAAKR